MKLTQEWIDKHLTSYQNESTVFYDCGHNSPYTFISLSIDIEGTNIVLQLCQGCKERIIGWAVMQIIDPISKLARGIK
jgi:hypothetical protein